MIDLLPHHVLLDLGVLDLQPIIPLYGSHVLPLQRLMLCLQLRVLLPEIIQLPSQTLHFLHTGRRGG